MSRAARRDRRVAIVTFAAAFLCAMTWAPVQALWSVTDTAETSTGAAVINPAANLRCGTFSLGNTPLSWDPPASGPAPARYQVQQDGVDYGSPTSSTTMTVPGSLGGYVYRVVSIYDPGGWRSLPSPGMQITLSACSGTP